MLQIKEQEKSPETNSNEIGACDLPNGELKMTVLKILPKVRRAMHKQVRIPK